MHLSENTLLDFSHGLLTATDAAQAEAHIDACSECRALVTAWVRLDDSAGGDEPPAVLPMRGASVGRYLVLDSLGAGSMGVVFSAYDPVLDRKVALKFLHAERHLIDPEEGRQRLLREAQALARVSHPNVVAVHDVGTWNEQVFLAMEFVDGKDLSAFLAGRERSVATTLATFCEAGQGLAAVHAAGLVHRDFKSSNVLVDAQGRVRVTDFGLARAELLQPAPRETPTSLTASPSLTQTGAVLGTPAYMAPEQHVGGSVDARTDQFAFCVALYEALYGQLPFGVLPVAQLAKAVASGRVLDAPAGSAVPVWVRRILLRGLSVDPAARFASMDSLVAALRDDPRRRQVRWLLGAVVTVGLVAVVGAMGFVASPEQRYCQHLDAPMVAAWNDAVRTRVQRTFDVSGAPFGGQAWRSVSTVLDAYAHAWVEQRVDACRATRVRGEQSEALMDLRIECLDRRRTAFSALVNALEHADVQGLERATDAALALEAVAVCSDGATLRLVTAPPREVRADVGRLNDALAETSVLLELGRYEAGLERTVSLVEEAKRLGYLPALADVYDLQGRLFARLDRYDDAERSLRLAHHSALASNSVVRATETVTELTSVVGDGLRRFKEGHELAEVALAMITARGAGELAVAEVLQADGAVAMRASEYARSLELETRAIAMMEKQFGPASPRLAHAVMQRANALSSMARYAEAEAGYQRVYELWTAEHGPEHPNVGRALSNLCLIRHRQHRSAEAVTACRRALDIYAKISPDFPEIGVTLTHLGVALVQLRQLDEAVASYTRAIAVLEKAHGAEHALVATPLNNRANVYSDLQRPDDAEADYARALAIREKALGPDHADVGETVFNLADLRRRRGHFAEALPLYVRALAIDEKRLGVTHAFLAGDLLGLGESQIETGHAVDAVPLLERAVSISEQGDDAEELGSIRFSLAKALRATHAPREQVKTVIAQAKADFAKCGADCAESLKALTTWAAP